MNPMLAGLSRSRMHPAVSQIKQMMNCGNPQMMLNQVPQYRQVMQYVNENGGDAQAAFYKKAEELGIDPNEILSQLR